MSRDDIRISDGAVREATGRTWGEWEEALDRWDAGSLLHGEIVALVLERGGVESGWWQQAVANGYEKLKDRRTVGESAAGGFQIGVRKTVDLAPADAWTALTSPEGVRTWLGGRADLREGQTFELDDGTRGEVRVVNPGQHLRVTRQPPGWSRPSTIQPRVVAKDDGRCVISFHEEHLPDADTREARRTHFREALAEIVRLASR